MSLIPYLVAIGIIVLDVLLIWGISAYLDRRDRRRLRIE